MMFRRTSALITCVKDVPLSIGGSADQIPGAEAFISLSILHLFNE